MSVLFWLKRTDEANGKVPVLARVTIAGHPRKEISLGIKVNPKDWDLEFKQVGKNDPNSKTTNKKIRDTEKRLEDLFKELTGKIPVVTPEMVKRAYHGLPVASENKDGLRPTLMSAFDYHISRFEKMVQKQTRSKGTLTHWKSNKKLTQSFLRRYYRKDDIPFSEINYMFAEQLYDFLTIEKDEPQAEVTAKKHIKWVRQIVSIGVKRQWIAANPLADFSCSGGDNEVEPLEYQEVISIYKKKLEIPRLEQIRDCFIVQCFSGFAFQDINALTPEHIELIGTEGERWLRKKRGKTDVTEAVPVLPIVEEIIKKYEHHPCRTRHNRLFPVPSNKNYNGYLKELAIICGILRELNTHLARHTFADIMLNLGVPLEVVGKMLGHKSIRTTQRYCKVRNVLISRQMKNVRKQIFHKSGKLKLAVAV